MSPYALEDWFMWVAAFASLFYFLIGIVSLLGHKLWRVFHAAAMLDRYVADVWIVEYKYTAAGFSAASLSIAGCLGYYS